MSKIQLLKAAHNCTHLLCYLCYAVCDVKDTTFESGSQHLPSPPLKGNRCLRCQRYNFWKRLTTKRSAMLNLSKLFAMSKIQLLKAAHNHIHIPNNTLNAVCDVKDTTFESGSQLIFCYILFIVAVCDVKDTTFESGSQLSNCFPAPCLCCLRCQRYNFWKRLTTYRPLGQKFHSCLRCQRYNFWKRLTTILCSIATKIMLFAMSKIQLLKAAHNYMVGTSNL